MKATAMLLSAFGLMWLAVILQNMILFFSNIIIVLVLIILQFGWCEITNNILKFFILLKISSSRLYRKNNSIKFNLSENNKILWLVKPILKNKMMLLIQKKINVKVEQEIKNSGKAYNPRILAQQGIAYMIFSFFILAPTSIILGFFVSPFLFLILVISSIWLFYPKLKLRLLALERRSSIDDEIAFFALYASVMQSVGQSLYNSIIDVLGRNIFPTIENEGKMLSRDIQVFGMDPITALNDHGYSHPNPYFRNLLLGYASISKSGGNLASYMERRSEEFFHKTQFKYANYRTQSHVIGETMLILLTILPTMILISSFLLAKNSISVVTILTFVLIPIVTIFMILLINNSQPKIRNTVDLNLKSIFVAAAAVVILLLADQQSWFVIAIGVAIGATLNFVFCLSQFREIAHIESVLADFFRDITEYRKIGIPIPNAIIKISEERNYNNHFDNLISIVSGRLKHGIRLSDILTTMLIRSWIARVSFFVLGRISDSGGGTPEILEQITNFSTDINQTKKETHASTSVISYFALASPVMMAYTTKEMFNVLEKLNTGLTQMSQNVFNIEALLTSGELITIINLLNVISAISLGLVMSKLAHFSMKHTLILGLMVLSSVLSVTLSPFFPSLVQ